MPTKKYSFRSRKERDAFLFGLQVANEISIDGVNTEDLSGFQYEQGIFDDRDWVAEVSYEDIDDTAKQD
jgi:hypothetical protein